MNENTNGRLWARWFLGISLVTSVAGNVLHTFLITSHISLWLRVPPAVLWPLLTFGGIEIIVRMIWERKLTHHIGRNILLVPAIPAAIVSYQHLYSLLLLMGEERFIALIGPVAVDGMMIGCTMVLLFTRALPAPIIISRLNVEHQEADAALADAERAFTLAAMLPQPLADAVPISAPPATTRTRAPRAQWDAALVTELAVDGVKNSEAREKAGIGESTFGRYKKVANMLKANPTQNIDVQAEKVPLEHVEMMRKLVSR